MGMDMSRVHMTSRQLVEILFDFSANICCVYEFMSLFLCCFWFKIQFLCCFISCDLHALVQGE